jgi:hypothetical protein
MNLEGYTEEKLWQILVDTVHVSVMYPTHKAYIRDNIFSATPDISPTDLATRLNMPFGEALVILSELSEEKK